MMKKIIVREVSKKFRMGFKKNRGALARLLGLFSGRLPRKDFWALKGISFNVKKGEVVGIIGENGSGKSTILRIISGIYPPSKGSVYTKGNLIPLIGFGAGLNGRLTMKENIFLVGSLFDLSRRDIKNRFDSIVEFAGLEDFVETKLYQFSSGMTQRLAFSIAIHANPEILILDEVFSVGDEDFRNKSANKIKELARKGTSVLFVSHELWMIEKYCDRVIWMSKGKIVKEGKTKELIKEYKKCSKN